MLTDGIITAALDGSRDVLIEKTGSGTGSNSVQTSLKRCVPRVRLQREEDNGERATLTKKVSSIVRSKRTLSPSGQYSGPI